MPDGDDLLPALEGISTGDASPEGLRDASIKGIDAVLGSWLARRHLSADQLRLLQAQRAFWRAAGRDALAALKEAYDREPVGG